MEKHKRRPISNRRYTLSNRAALTDNVGFTGTNVTSQAHHEQTTGKGMNRDG
jgi:hypothetical protein